MDHQQSQQRVRLETTEAGAPQSSILEQALDIDSDEIDDGPTPATNAVHNLDHFEFAEEENFFDDLPPVQTERQMEKVSQFEDNEEQ